MVRRQIKIFLADGSPTGLRVAQLGLSTLKVVVAPRTKLAALAKREEAGRTGVYILRGPDPDKSGWESVYVGEGDNVFKRIQAHDKDDSKDFWEEVLLFVSKDDNLTKAHVRYVEAKLIERAIKAKRATVVNGNAPNGGQLPEADQAEMSELMEHILLLLGTLGLHAFQPASEGHVPTPSPESAFSPEPEIELFMSGSGFDARCVLQDGEFVVQAGSMARVEEMASLQSFGRTAREALLSNGVLVPKDDGLSFTQSYSFKSASGAAAVISASSVNGRRTWKLADGRTLGDWEASLLGPVAGSDT